MPLLTYVRTKVRRLYDIANVLATLGLLEHCMTPNTLKPGYRWLHAPGGACDAPGPVPAPPPVRHVPCIGSRSKVWATTGPVPAPLPAAQVPAGSWRCGLHAFLAPETAAREACILTRQHAGRVMVLQDHQQQPHVPDGTACKIWKSIRLCLNPRG